MTGLLFQAAHAVQAQTPQVPVRPAAEPGAAPDLPPLPPDATFQFTLAKLLSVEGSIPEALAAFEEAARLAPDSAYVRLEQAQLLARIAQYARVPATRQEYLRKAAVAIDEAKRLAPANLDVLRTVGQVYLDLSTDEPAAVETARTALEEVLRRDPMDIASAVALGQLDIDAKQYDKAVQVLRDLIVRVPQQRMAYALLVEALLRAGKPAEAEAMLGEILGFDPGSLEARMTLADLQSERGDHEAAVATLSAAPEQALAEPRLRRKLAWELYLSGNLAAALPAADALLAGHEQDPEADSLRLLKGLILSAEGRNAEALELLDPIRRAQPDNTALAMTVSRLYQREGRHAEAAALLRERLERRSQGAQGAQGTQGASGGATDNEQELRLELAQVYFDGKDWKKLDETLAPLLQSADDGVRAQALVLQADGLAEAKKYDEALAVLDRGGSNPPNPPNPVIESRRAEVLIRAGREREGREQLAALAKSADPASVLSAVQAFHRLERYEESIPVLQGLIAAHPDQLIGHFLLGAAYERTDQREKAVAELRRVLSIEPDFHAALNYLGYTFAEAGENLDEALKLIQRAVALDPDNGSYVDSLGWAYFQLGRHDEARGYLERAVRLEPTDATLQEHLGDVYVALGQNDRAREAYHRALELGDDNAEQVRRKLDRLESATPRR